jgi:DamX protein
MQTAAPEPVTGETNRQAIPSLDVAEQAGEAERAQPRIADGEAAVSIATIEETEDVSVADGPVPQQLASQPASAALAPASPAETPAAEAAPAATARAVEASVVPVATPEAEQEVAMPTPAPNQAEASETPQPKVAEAAAETDSSLQGASLVKGPEWLARQRPGSLTIQLLAVENIESIQEVIDKYKLHGEAFAVKSERQGKAWYPLLWGRFTGLTEAQTALKRLPPELLQGGAWIRSLASLQQ